MGKIYKDGIRRFDGGWTNDIRDQSTNKLGALSHFDIYTRPYRLTPYRDMELADGDAANNFITQFLVYNSKVYGFGTSSGGTLPRIWERSDFTGSTWTAHSPAGTGIRYPYVFIEQGTTAYLWESSTPDLLVTDLDGSSAPSALFGGGTFTGATFFGQPCVHSKDKKVYLPYDNKIARNDYGVLSESAVLTLPSSLQIVCVSEYGNYLAILARPAGGRIGNSTVFLWDRDSSLATLSELYDVGSEAGQIVDSVDGDLVVISGNINVSSANLNPKMVFRRFNGLTFEVFHELQASAIIPSQVITRERHNGRLYFNLTISVNGTSYAGVWSLGKTASGIALNMDYNPDPVNTVALVYGFKHVNDYLFVSYNYGSTDTMSKTNDSASYTTTSFAEKTFRAKSPKGKDKILGVSLTHAPLPAAGQIVLKYKKDAESSFTSIKTNSTDDSLRFSEVGKDIGEFHEITFRIESTGGAEPYELYFEAEEIDRAPY